MLSAVGESAQVALQASTLPGKDNKSERSSEGSGGKGKDRVTLSPEAVQLTHAALNATEKPHDNPQGPQEDGADDQRVP